MRQGEEHDVVVGETGGGGLGEHPVGQRDQVRLVLGERRARVAARRQGADLDLGVREQQPEEFSPGVPTRTRYRDPNRHTHDYARPCKFTQTAATNG